MAFTDDAMLTKLLQTLLNSLSEDLPQIKTFSASAYSCLLAHRATFDLKHHRPSQNSILNLSYEPVMNILLDNLKHPDSLRLNLFNGNSDAFNTCGENCDSVELKDENMRLLSKLLNEISNIIGDPNKELPSLNHEQREVLINCYCGAVQVFLYTLGKENLDRDFTIKITQLVVYMFTKMGKVSTGPLLILNGLISAIED